MPSQSAFEFASTKSFLQDDFIVSSCNIDAFRMVTSWPMVWQSNCLLITGDKASGKTFLSRIWQERSGARFIDIENAEKIFQSGKPGNIIVEDIDQLLPQKEEALFHLYNNILNNKSYLLLTSSKPLMGLDIKLADLRSRLGASAVVNIMQPDNELLKGIIFKQFSDLQLQFQPGLIDFLVPRIERSFEAVTKMVNELNRKSLESKRNITIPFVKEVLGL